MASFPIRDHIENGNLICTLHGLAFNHEGVCVKVPAYYEQKNLPSNYCSYAYSYQVVERYGLIWITLGSPSHDIISIPEWFHPNNRCFAVGPYHFDSSPMRALENFVDVTHIPIIHNFLGNIEHPEINDYEVEYHPEELGHGAVISSSDIMVWTKDKTVVDDIEEYIKNTFKHSVYRPLIVCADIGPPDRRLRLFHIVTPISEEECIAWQLVVMNYGLETPIQNIQSVVDQLAVEDNHYVSTQTPKKLPLNPKQEFNLRSDLTSITYRKWLRELGVTYGCAQ